MPSSLPLPLRPLRTRTRTRFGLAACAITLALSFAAPASAQDAQKQAMGRALFNEGMSLYTKGDYESACPKFEASLEHYAGLGTRGKLAECYEKLGRFASAWQQYREVAQLATRQGDPNREQVAAGRAKSLEPKLSYITIVVPPGRDVPGLVIKRGGKEVDLAKIGAAELVDSGGIAIEVAAPGRKTFSGQLTVMNGQSARFEVPVLESTAPAPVTSQPPPPVDEPPATLRGDPPAWHKPVGLVLIGGGVVSFAVGGVLGLAAKSKYDGAFDGGGCDSATKTCDAPGQQAVDDARSQASLATIMFGAGGVLVVAGAVVLLTAPSGSSRAIRVSPTTYAGGGGVVIGGAL